DQCRACTLTFQNPRLAADVIQWIYSSAEYWGDANPNKTSAYYRYEQNDHLRIKQSERRLKIIMKVSGVRSGNLLDVGCATGFFGHVAAENGFTVTGIEPSQRMAQFGQQQYGVNIKVGTLEDTELPGAHFDLVTLWGTDSHFLHPREGFAKLALALK